MESSITQETTGNQAKTQKTMPGNKGVSKTSFAAAKHQDVEKGPAEKKSRFCNSVQNGSNQGSKDNFAGFSERNRGGGGSSGNFQNNDNDVQVNKDKNKNDGKMNQPQQQQFHNSRNRGGGNRDRNRGGRGQGGQGGHNSSSNSFSSNARGDEFFIQQKLRLLIGPTHELPPIEVPQETKFSGRNRLYIGNLTNDVVEDELRELFKPYGEVGEVFLNTEKNFAFLKVDFHANAEKAKRALDGFTRKGRQLRVRFAPNATILRVSNLTSFVTNELLYKSFEIFGPLERALITVDDRGKHTGEGIIEFVKKSSSNACLRICNEKCFFLTASLRPCLVQPFDINDDNDGLPEKSLNKKTQEFNYERSVGPRFAEPGSFEHEYGTRWKQLDELFKSKQEALKREMKMEEQKLEAQMEYARYEHETELLRQELRKRESDNERKKMEWELKEKQAEEMQRREEENMRRQQTEMQSRMNRQEDEMRRRQQENTLFMQAQQLNSLLDQQESCGNPMFDGGFMGNNSPFDNVRGFNNNAQASGNNNRGGNNNPHQEQAAFDFGNNNNKMGQRGGGGGNNGAGNNVGKNNNPWDRQRRF